MKYIIILSAFLVACGGSGGDSCCASGGSPAVPDDSGNGNPGVTCKGIDDIWTSTSDSEKHDFRALPLTSASWSRYEYRGYTGTNCPDASFQTSNAKLYLSGSVAANAGYQYTIQFQNNAPSMGCDRWQTI